MEEHGSKRVDIAGANDNWQNTAFCGTLVGDFLPVKLIYKDRTPACHPKIQCPPDWDITHSPKHWSNKETMIQYTNNIVTPYIKSARVSFSDDTPALVSMDDFKGHITSIVTDIWIPITSMCAYFHQTRQTNFSLWSSPSTSLRKTFWSGVLKTGKQSK